MTSADIIATCSVVIAFLAFAATVWQARLAHTHNRLSVRPLLVWHVRRDSGADGATTTYVLKNLGLGPAIIRDRYFTKEGVRFEAPLRKDEVTSFVASVLQNKVNYQLKIASLPGRGAAIPSQGEVTIGQLFYVGARADQVSSYEELAGIINFHVRYESMYEETFTFSALTESAA